MTGDVVDAEVIQGDAAIVNAENFGIPTCQDPCPPVCESVFDRVVVDYLIRGQTRVMWELLPTFTDPRPLTFQLQVGVTPNHHSGDWTDVGLPVTDQYFAYDPEQRVWGKTNWTHYRVKLTTIYGTYYSDPVDGLGTLERRSWRHAREIIRQHMVAFRMGPGGQEGYLLKMRWTGTPCPRCLDYQTQLVKDPDCPVCYGTGVTCGYYYPMSCVYVEMSPRSYHTKIDSEHGRGVVKDIAVKARVIMTAMVGEYDVWVARKTDERYIVHAIQHVAEIRGIPILADVEMRPVPYTSIIYTIPIPRQLAAVGLGV